MISKREGLVIRLSLLVLLLAGAARAQGSAAKSATISAAVLPGVSITSSGGGDGLGNLSFGLVIVNNTAAINPNTSLTASLFAITAGSNMPMTASFSSPTVTLYDTAGNSLSFTPQAVGAQLSTSQSTAANVTSGSQITMSGTGQYYIWIGGTVVVPGTAAGGTYTGNFSLTVAYQ